MQLTEKEKELLDLNHTYYDKQRQFVQAARYGKTLIEDFGSYMKEEFQLELNSSSALILFNQQFSIDTEIIYMDLPKASLIINHVIFDHNLKLKEKIEIFRKELSDFVKYEHFGHSNVYPIMFGAILKYLEDYKSPLN